MFILKQKSSLLGKKKCSYKNNKKELQNLLPWNLELLAPTSARAKETSCTKAHISPREKFGFQKLENADALHITENLITRTVLQSICTVTKMPFSEKTNTFYEEYHH